jgi:hypothetical protein
MLAGHSRRLRSTRWAFRARGYSCVEALDHAMQGGHLTPGRRNRGSTQKRRQSAANRSLHLFPFLLPLDKSLPRSDEPSFVDHPWRPQFKTVRKTVYFWAPFSSPFQIVDGSELHLLRLRRGATRNAHLLLTNDGAVTIGGVVGILATQITFRSQSVWLSDTSNGTNPSNLCPVRQRDCDRVFFSFDSDTPSQ